MTDASGDPPLFYRAHVFFCTNKRPPGHERGCCADKGAERLRSYMKKRAKEIGIDGVRINTAGCLDRCELGPTVVVYPEGVWYSPKNEADIDEILTVHLQNNGRVERLMLQADRKIRVTTGAIFALASAPGRGGVAVIRISGPDAARALDLCAPSPVPDPREAALRDLRHPEDRTLIDRALVLWFPAPHSFTGENVVEFHIHGGRAVAGALLECLRNLSGFRLAEPGEFTRRAFENGKLDLTEAEAIADLVNAETEAQRRQAMRQFEGELGRLYEKWRQSLTQILAHLEAAIDFSDEDLPKDMELRVRDGIGELTQNIALHLDDRHRGERLREGFHVAILGPPNAGKSSLLNVLARRDAAIVSATAGTTRDIVEVHLDLGGYPVILADTAGLRDSADAIESEGVRRALARAEKADLKLLVFDGAQWPDSDAATSALIDDDTLAIVNKADLMPNSVVPGIKGHKNLFVLPVSVKTGKGVPELLDAVIAAIDLRFADTGAPPLTRERHRAALTECGDYLRRALTAPEVELRAEDLRQASRALGRITGRVDVEDLLDVIFRDFCIGK